MQRLLADIEAGRVALLICVDWNRLSRDEDIIDGLRIKKACKDNGVLVVTPGRVYDFSTEADGFLAQLEMMFAASQKQKLVKATTRGWYAKARSGGWVGGTPAYGYRVVYDAPHRDGRMRGRLEVDPGEADVVWNVYRWYADGRVDERGEWRPMSMTAIAQLLNDQGHRFRVRKKITNRRYADGGSALVAGDLRRFEMQDVKNILKNRGYLGVFGYGESQISKWVKADGPVEVVAPHLQIVDVALWKRAQAVRSERARGPRRSACATRPLAGLLRCPHCGGLMSAFGRGRRRLYSDSVEFVEYRCLNERKYGRSVCAGHNLSERAARRAVEALLVDQLKACHLNPALTLAAEQASAEHGTGAEQALQVEVQQVEEKLGRLVIAVAEGALTPAEVRGLKLDLMEKKERLEGRLDGIRQHATVRSQLMEAIRHVREHLAESVQGLDPARFRQLARMVFAKVVLTGTGNGPARTARVGQYDLTPGFSDYLNTCRYAASAANSSSTISRIARSGSSALVSGSICTAR
jgi:site-specific DNA recombinase